MPRSELQADVELPMPQAAAQEVMPTESASGVRRTGESQKALKQAEVGVRRGHGRRMAAG